MAVTSRPTAKKTSINFGNSFGGSSDLGNVSPLQSKVSSANHIRSLQSQRRVLERLIELEGDVGEIQTRLQMQDESLLAVREEHSAFQQSLAGIRESVGTLQSGQKAIIDNAKDTEKIKEKQQKLEEQRLKRKGAEKGLEGLGAADKDVEDKKDAGEKVAEKAKGILGTLGNFFKFVIAGWFTDKTFKLLEAFQSGNKGDIKKIGMKLLAGAAAVGGIMLLAAGAIGPIIAGVFSLIGTLAALLLNPVTLTALLIAVGVGGAIMGIRALWKWGKNKAAGGKSFGAAHKENNEKLKELKKMGVNKKGKVKYTDEEGKERWGSVDDYGTDAQKELWNSFSDERDRIDGIRDNMRSEMDDARKEWKANAIANKPEGGKVDWETEDKKWKEQKAAIRAKHEAQISPPKGDGSNVGSTASGDTAASNIGPAETTEGSISVIPNYTQQVEDVAEGVGSEVHTLASGNSDNMYIMDAKSNFNMV